jgi:asparagine synthase (glutamine-hydrolysing)
MTRFCAAVGSSVPAGAVRPGSLELLPGEPGVAAGPWHATRPDGTILTAVGEVTLHDGQDGPRLLRAYAADGLAGIARAEGMFALAVRDGDDLVLIRDHVGARTLFYTHTPNGWLASTSLRHLRHHRDVDTGLNLAAVRSFLTFAYLPGDETLLRGVHEVLPGRALRLRPDGTRAEEIFWEPREEIDHDATPAEHAARLRMLLEAATARRLPDTGDVAVLLSGGVDSSLVTALASTLLATRGTTPERGVRTYSISFGSDLPNELAYSGLVAAHCHTRHRVLDVAGPVIADRLAATVALLDSPVGDPLTVPNLLLAEAVAADGLPVVLNGEGGDPVFGGPKNLPMLIYELHRDDPAPGARAEAYLRSYRKCYLDLPTLLAPDVLAALDGAPHPARFVAPYLAPGRMDSLLNQLLHVNLRTKGAHHILTKVERLTAACGLSGRAPLFDRQVIDHAFTVPPALKLAGSVEKWVLKEAVRDLLPATVVDRPKSGMRVPVQQWLSGPLRDLAGDALTGFDLVDRATLRTWLRGGGTLLPRQGGKVWLVLTLALWLRAYAL